MWFKDPLTNQPSVALTLLILATALMVAGTVMECFTSVRSTHLLDELFGAAVTLYGSHLFAFRSNNTNTPGNTDITP